MSISNYYENKILNHMIRGTTFTPPTVRLALHTADPGEAGSTSTEVSGGSYARKNVTFSAAGAGSGTTGVITLSSAADFAGMPSSTIKYLALWDSTRSGNCLWSGPLSANKIVTAGDTLRISTITVSLD